MHSLMDEFYVLLVEDNPGDVRLIQEAAKECRIQANIKAVKDGDGALELLHAADHLPGNRLPDMILLDLNLPGKNGLDVLNEIKSSPKLLRTPVVVLSSSESVQDIRGAYERHANCYISKPSSLEKYIAVVHSIYAFWLNTVELPFKENAHG